MKEDSAAVFTGDSEDEENYVTDGEGESGSEVDETQTLEIQETGTDFLNVRDIPGGDVVTTVTPGEVYVFVDYVNGWYQIILEDGTLGWVSAEYVESN